MAYGESSGLRPMTSSDPQRLRLWPQYA